MSTQASASATSEVIKWARICSSLKMADVESKSKLKKLTAPRLKAIESGEIEPTISEVMEFARIYKRPFSLFFLPEPPAPIPEIPDLRISPSHDAAAQAALSLSISRAYEVQEVITELSNGKQIPGIPVPDASIKSDPEKLADWVRAKIGIEKVFDNANRHAADALERWIKVTENFGVIVLQETFAPDTSAFSIGDIKPPVAVVCFKDAERKRIFSLFHELAHIILRQSAICNTGIDRAKHDEKFCDKFAANLLMPALEVRELAPTYGRDLDRLADAISVRTGASVEAAFVRLVDLELASYDDYLERKPRWDEAYRNWLAAQKNKKGGPNPNPVGTAMRKGGSTLSRVVSGAIQAGQLSRAEASHIMRLPARELPTLIKRAS